MWWTDVLQPLSFPPTDEDVTYAVSRAPFIDFEISVMDWFISEMAEAVVVEISIVRSLILRSCVMSLASFVTETTLPELS